MREAKRLPGAERREGTLFLAGSGSGTCLAGFIRRVRGFEIGGKSLFAHSRGGRYRSCDSWSFLFFTVRSFRRSVIGQPLSWCRQLQLHRRPPSD